jgi:DNA gyrase/topoisomerase IV subunit B
MNTIIENLIYVKWHLVIVVLDSDDGMCIRTGLINFLTRDEVQASDV